MRHLPTIRIKIIPHNEQRYDTAGDYWQTKRGNWEVRISEMIPERELAVILHELYEMVATKLDEVDWKDIDYFDKEGEGKDMADPGASRKAPYHKQHMDATKIEKQVIKNFKMDWQTYDNSFEQLK